MARELPLPLPPAERTVGQLVGETIRAYGDRFWPSLVLGAPLTVSTQVSVGRSADAQTVILLAFTPLIAAAFVRACTLVHRVRPTAVAYACAVLVFLPVPLLVRVFVLPAVAWLALFGLAVPAAMIERLGFRAALERGRRLAVADYAHAAGSLAALVLVVGVSELALVALLRSQGDNGERVAHALADLVISPLLYLGGALLYVDQAARAVVSRRQKRHTSNGGSRDGDLHPPVDTDAAGRADPQVEP